MRVGHAPYSKHEPRIAAALDRAAAEGANGVLSCFHLKGADSSTRRQAAGFVYGRAGFEDETPLQTSSITAVGHDEITTSNGRRYLIADYQGDAKDQLKALKSALRKSSRK